MTSGQQYRGGSEWQHGRDVKDLTPYLGDPNSIPLYSHEVIWFLIGPQLPASLPNVHFYEEF